MAKEDIQKFSIEHDEPAWLLNKRLDAFEQAETLELPHIERANFRGWKLESTAIGETSASQAVPDFTALDNHPLIVQIGSQTVFEQLPQALAEQGVILTSFADALTDYPELIEKHLGTVVSPDEDKITASNLASFNSGVVLIVPDNVTVTEPIEVQIFHNADSYIPFNKRVLIIAGKNSKFSYLERLQSTTDGTDKTTGNFVVEVIAQEGAEVKYAAIDELNEHLTAFITRRASIAENATVDWSIGIFNDGNIIADFDSDLRGTNSRSNIKAVGISTGRQIQVADTRVTNYGNQSVGHILQHGVALEKGTLTFNGIGHIIKGAKGAGAQQKTKVLMLSDTARTDANPILLIDENDVTAGHAASIGQIDPDDLYYLQSRGLDEEEAKHLVVRGFLGAVISEIPVKSVRQEMIQTIDQKLSFVK
ncbi:MAG: Fe-S cluster assembly protein SufD [Streptococcaceae bacterium]|jgi:Fe-S cluster assembly protein SufD|nr:Fe-S cluster assembly protein SufD [Streptococcaceae bacterium]